MSSAPPESKVYQTIGYFPLVVGRGVPPCGRTRDREALPVSHPTDIRYGCCPLGCLKSISALPTRAFLHAQVDVPMRATPIVWMYLSECRSCMWTRLSTARSPAHQLWCTGIPRNQFIPSPIRCSKSTANSHPELAVARSAWRKASALVDEVAMLL